MPTNRPESKRKHFNWTQICVNLIQKIVFHFFHCSNSDERQWKRNQVNVNCTQAMTARVTRRQRQLASRVLYDSVRLRAMKMGFNALPEINRSSLLSPPQVLSQIIPRSVIPWELGDECDLNSEDTALWSIVWLIQWAPFPCCRVVNNRSLSLKRWRPIQAAFN